MFLIWLPNYYFNILYVSNEKSYSNHPLAVRSLLQGAKKDYSSTTPHRYQNPINDNVRLHHRRTLFPNKNENRSTSSSFVLSSTSTPPKTTSSLSSPISSSVLAGNGSPPIYSPLGLIEELYSNDPWKLLISTIFLNRTRRIQVDRILYKFFERYPTPQDLLISVNEGNSSSCSKEEEKMSDCDNDNNQQNNTSTNEIEILSTMIRPLGFNHRRAKGIIQFTHDYVQLIKEKKKKKKLLLQQTEEETRTEQQQCYENHVVKKEIDSTTTMQQEDDTVILPPPELTFSRNDVESFYQCGTYAADAYEIFIRKNWDTNSKKQPPTDHALRAYVEWKERV